MRRTGDSDPALALRVDEIMGLRLQDLENAYAAGVGGYRAVQSPERAQRGDDQDTLSRRGTPPLLGGTGIGIKRMRAYADQQDGPERRSSGFAGQLFAKGRKLTLKMQGDDGDKHRVQNILDKNGTQPAPHEVVVDDKATRVESLEQRVASQEAKIASLQTRIDTELPQVAQKAKKKERANKILEQIRVLAELLAGAWHTQ